MLYEVITDDVANGADDHVRQREHEERREAHGQGVAGRVITSYSIHYTKLYDGGAIGGSRGPAQGADADVALLTDLFGRDRRARWRRR